MIKYTLLAPVALIIMSSCKKEPLQETDKIVVTAISTKNYGANYQEYAHTNGTFYIWTECYIWPRPSIGITYTNDISVYGSFYNKPSDTIPTIGGNVMIDTLRLYSSPNYNYHKSNYDSTLYGKNINISLTPPNGQAPAFTAQMYMPKQIFAYMGKTTLANATYYLQNHSDTLYWNADPKNTNGIAIGEALASNYNGQVVVGNSFIFNVPDNGMYVLPKSFYAAFAPGTSVTFTVSRRTYTLITYNQYKYLLDAYCYTPVFSWIVP